MDARRDTGPIVIGGGSPPLVVDGRDHAVKSDFRSFQDHQDIPRADLFVEKSEANGSSVSTGLFHRLEFERGKFGPESLCVAKRSFGIGHTCKIS